MTTFHVIAVLSAIYTTTGGDRVVERRLEALNPDTQYATVTDCREAMRNDPNLVNGIVRTAEDLQKMISSSTQTGAVVRAADNLVCVSSAIPPSLLKDIE